MWATSTSMLRNLGEQNCGDNWCNKSHSHRKQIIPDTAYADVRHALLFRNGETSPPGYNTDPGKTWQVGKLWLKSLLPRAFSSTLSSSPQRPTVREKVERAGG
jgi:hypothetical protein